MDSLYFILILFVGVPMVGLFLQGFYEHRERMAKIAAGQDVPQLESTEDADDLE